MITLRTVLPATSLSKTFVFIRIYIIHLPVSPPLNLLHLQPTTLSGFHILLPFTYHYPIN